MTQVYRVLPLGYNPTPVPLRRQPRRGFSDIRHGHGGKPRLTPDDVRAMRLAAEWGWPPVIVSKAFSVNYHYAQLVMSGATHAHVR